jgi:G3E family GTPase
MAVANDRGAIPILVVSGFLGSGKTTLLRNLLLDPEAGEIAVIVNEFGEVGIDHHLVRKTDVRTTLLRNGCVCCSMRDDLSEALRHLLSQRERGTIPRFCRVVIETTGLADPAPILHTIVAEPVVRNHFRVERVVTTIDAVNGASNLDSYGEALRQVAAADHLIVTKLDLAAPEATDDLKARLRSINPAASVVEASFGSIDFAPLLGEELQRGGVGFGRLGGGEADDAGNAGDAGVAPTDARFPRVAPHSSARPLDDGLASSHMSVPVAVHAMNGRVASRCLVFDRPLNWQMFGIWLTMLLHRHGDRVLRLKGLLNVGAERGPLLVEGVQHVIHVPRHLREWPDADRRSRIVFIARDLDLAQVEASLEAFQDLAAAV